MNCVMCRKPISAARMRWFTHAKRFYVAETWELTQVVTCSPTCKMNRQRERMKEIAAAGREALRSDKFRAALKLCILRLDTAKQIIVAECDPDEEDVQDADDFIAEMRALTES